jgi:hypothetical protein
VPLEKQGELPIIIVPEQVVPDWAIVAEIAPTLILLLLAHVPVQVPATFAGEEPPPPPPPPQAVSKTTTERTNIKMLNNLFIVSSFVLCSSDPETKKEDRAHKRHHSSAARPSWSYKTRCFPPPSREEFGFIRIYKLMDIES